MRGEPAAEGVDVVPREWVFSVKAMGAGFAHVCGAGPQAGLCNEMYVEPQIVRGKEVQALSRGFFFFFPLRRGVVVCLFWRGGSQNYLSDRIDCGLFFFRFFFLFVRRAKHGFVVIFRSGVCLCRTRVS